MSRKYRVDELLADLSETERQEYSALARGPATTIDDLLAWLQDHGCAISRGAVWKHRRNYQEVLDEVKRSAEMARAFAQVARDGGCESLGEASLARFQQLMAEKLLRMDVEEELDASELMKLAQAMNSAANTRQRIEAVKAEYDQRQKDALIEASKVVQAGGNGAAVVSKVREILGIQ